MCFWTSTKSILKGFLIYCTWNKVVQNPKNKIEKKEQHLSIDINDSIVYIREKIVLVPIYSKNELDDCKTL
jgi:hypothetical protein